MPGWCNQFKHPTIDLGSDYDLTVYEFEPCIRLCAPGAEHAWDFSHLLSAPPPTVNAFSLSLTIINKL